MMSKNQYATEAFITFMGYILMSTLTLGFIFPIQRIVASASLDNIGLLYLPHGVTALAFFTLAIGLGSTFCLGSISNGSSTHMEITYPLIH